MMNTYKLVVGIRSRDEDKKSYQDADDDGDGTPMEREVFVLEIG